MITLSCTKDTIMCPVKQGEMIINNLWELMGTSPNTIINTYLSAGVLYTLTAETALGGVRQKAQDLGATKLGHKPMAIGLHSIRSAAAMAMILSGVPNYMVMLIGRWKSDAFLTYVRKQVAEFTKSVSQQMITIPNFFHPPEQLAITLPEFTSQSTMAGREAHAMVHIPQGNKP